MTSDGVTDREVRERRAKSPLSGGLYGAHRQGEAQAASVGDWLHVMEPGDRPGALIVAGLALGYNSGMRFRNFILAIIAGAGTTAAVLFVSSWESLLDLEQVLDRVLRKVLSTNTAERFAITAVVTAVSVPGLVVAILVYDRLHGKSKQQPSRTCQRCGYEIRGNESWRCPRCGNINSQGRRSELEGRD